ncbi:flagellar hook-basal body complex protein FliE [Oceanobacillus sp. FSL H7-0719]|uniref:flagellar hook-basal body complex protein FliE n=1 Tax=Oceanobacillus sp. FSL H7-0719 TaxID=2954507 RepID=UPI003254C345
MNVNFMPSTVNAVNNQQISVDKLTPAAAQSNFADTLKGAIENLNQLQNESDHMTEALASGESVDLHNVMVTAQKASITLETTVQVQQKAIDAYNEIMRMQI